MEKCKCKRPKCLHEWWAKPRDDGKKPVQCPKCKSYKWDEQLEIYRSPEMQNKEKEIERLGEAVYAGEEAYRQSHIKKIISWREAE